MIIVTGGCGFIGSALVWHLNELGREDIVVVDTFGEGDKWLNLRKRKYLEVIDPENFLELLDDDFLEEAEVCFHMGATSSTTEKDMDFLYGNNFQFSRILASSCEEFDVPFIYASSAATYGNGEIGFSDDADVTPSLLPINKYGYSKQLFDEWMLEQEFDNFWAGFKFFNVFGPQEYHKGPQASVVYHAYPQIKDQNMLKLFKSYKTGIKHGEQKRDFVYVKDVVKVLEHTFTTHESVESGIFNLGTGTARSFSDLGKSVFQALNSDKPNFEWIEMPDHIKNQYQYFTEASMGQALEQLQYSQSFMSLEDAIKDYVCNYLDSNDPYL